MTTDKGKTDIFFVQLIKTENLRIKFTDKKKPMFRVIYLEKSTLVRLEFLGQRVKNFNCTFVI